MKDDELDRKAIVIAERVMAMFDQEVTEYLKLILAKIDDADTSDNLKESLCHYDRVITLQLVVCTQVLKRLGNSTSRTPVNIILPEKESNFFMKEQRKILRKVLLVDIDKYLPEYSECKTKHGE